MGDEQRYAATVVRHVVWRGLLMRGAFRTAVTVVVVLVLVGLLAALVPWRAVGTSLTEPLTPEPTPTPTVQPVVPVVLPEPVLPQPSVSVIAEPPAAPDPDPELDRGLAAAASVEWSVPEDRRDQSDGTLEKAKRPVVIEGCKNQLVQLLAYVGFKGENIREAWAIAMRESGGRSAVGPGDPTFNGADWGMFQFNRPTYYTQPWWNDAAMLDGEYNARVAYYMSRGGRSWYPWGLDGQGNVNAGAYDSIWTPQMIKDRIEVPYKRWYDQFPCTAEVTEDQTPAEQAAGADQKPEKPKKPARKPRA